jgi:hypothetical protein
MKLSNYITIEEVKRICVQLGIRDWTLMRKAQVTRQEAEKILAEIETGDMKIPMENFRVGLEVELEHGIRFPEANVTNNHPIITGKIVLAHFKETLDYYKRLEVVEIEGDLLKAVINKNPEKTLLLYKKLIKAKNQLSEEENTALQNTK